MFDTIGGLPLHALVVHAVVVLLPLMAVITAAVSIRRSWRRAAALVTAADGLLVLITLVAKQSGQALQQRLSSLGSGGALVAADHGQKGSLLPLFALGLFLAAALVWYGSRRPALTGPATLVAVVAALAAIGWCVVVGDSGARAVWAQVVVSTDTTTPR
jgi:hypothetical protein